MAATPVKLDNQLKGKLFALAAVLVGTMATGAFFCNQWFMSMAAAGFCVGLLLNCLANRTQKWRKTQKWLAHFTVVFLALVSFASMTHYHQTAEQWCYLLPLMAFFICKIQVAAIVTGLFSVAIAIALIGFYQGPEKVQIFFIYLLSLTMTLAFIYLREIKENQLKPLRRTDNLTLASTRKYLAQDLEKEIQRSEREGADLSVLALSLDPPCLENLSTDQFDLLLNQLGQLLHQQLRLFDSYYRYDEADFIIVLPYMGSKSATQQANTLRLNCRQALTSKEVLISVSMGVATLNAGDSGGSLIANARQALKTARTKGNNRTVSFLDMRKGGSVVGR